MPVSNQDILKTILLQELDRMEPEQSTFEDDPMQFILKKYAGLKNTLEYLMTPSFEEYITGIYVVAPKPTTFKVVLHNGQFLFLQFMGKAYEATVEGKKYYLMSIGEKERCMVAISRLLRFGNPLKTKGPDGAEQGTRDSEGPAEEAGPTPPAETSAPEAEGGEELTESRILENILRSEAVKSQFTGNKKAIEKLVATYPDQFQVQSASNRIANTTKMSSNDFEKIIKKDLKAKNIKVFPPDQSPNESSKFDMFQFDSEFGPVQIVLSGGSSANKGNVFESSLTGDLNKFNAEGFTKDNQSQFTNLELTKEIVRELGLKKGGFQVIEEGRKNQKRPLKITPEGPEIIQAKSVAETVTDITIVKGKEKYYISLKYGGTVTFFNSGVTKFLPASQIKSGKITDTEGVTLLKALGIDNKTFCEVFNSYAKGKPVKFPPKRGNSDKAKLQHLVSSGIGTGYYYAGGGKGSDLFFKIDEDYNKMASTIISDPIVYYGGIKGGGKRVDVVFESAKYIFKVNIRPKDRGVYPTHIMCDYKEK
jgi:hypothetical protein